jgi:hypothetical protein
MHPLSLSLSPNLKSIPPHKNKHSEKEVQKDRTHNPSPLARTLYSFHLSIPKLISGTYSVLQPHSFASLYIAVDSVLEAFIQMKGSVHVVCGAGKKWVRDW